MAVLGRICSTCRFRKPCICLHVAGCLVLVPNRPLVAPRPTFRIRPTFPFVLQHNLQSSDSSASLADSGNHAFAPVLAGFMVTIAAELEDIEQSNSNYLKWFPHGLLYNLQSSVSSATRADSENLCICFSVCRISGDGCCRT